MAPLDEYRRKRDFGHTPEPSGGTEGGGGTLRFVVQKHAARQLHYDLRLEHEGVLLSWAVPKGPSLDPADKRLAMRVEDHPFDYAGFEGTIPAGEYGGGTVMVWDRGTWEPLGDAAAMLAKGDLKFRLAGTKLSGDWVLARMRPRPGERGESWLLIKHRDGEARPRDAFDVLSEDLSAATGLTMEQIAAGEDGKPASATAAELPGAVPAPMPAELPFALCTKVAAAPEGDGWLHEVKLDGYRVMLRVEDGSSRAVTRNGADRTERFPVLADAAAALKASSAAIDGEAVVMRADGRTDFGALQEALSARRHDSVAFFAFDLPYLDGHDLRAVPLEDRKRALAELLRSAPAGSPLRYVDHVTGSGPEFASKACELALEGSISKRSGSRYPEGRSRDWVKVKCVGRQEFAVGGWTEPAAGRSGFGALLLGVYDGDELRYAGRVGSGFSERDLAAVRRRLDALAADAPPFGTPPRAKGVHWVRPRLVVEVSFAEWTKTGLLRQPVFVGVRDDKPAGEAVREAAAAEGPRVHLTNPDRVLWPEMGLTKRELAEYWTAVADRALPHVGGRLLTLVRCPSGHEKGCFYQKHVEAAFPDSVLTLAVPTKDGGKEFAYVEDADGLVALVQMGVLEVHTWGSPASSPETPDRIVFDLDPGPGVGWDDLVAGATLVRDSLTGAGLTAFVKTTGGAGLHVVAPIVPDRGWDEVRAFALLLARTIAETFPDRYTSKMAKRERTGRIFVDYVRNTRESTSVAPYSPRARAGAPVSTPVEWSQLGRLVAADLTVRSVPARLSGPDPWAGFAAAARPLPGAAQGPGADAPDA